MNKILFSLLLAGVSFGGSEGASAMVPYDEDTPEALYVALKDSSTGYSETEYSSDDLNAYSSNYNFGDYVPSAPRKAGHYKKKEIENPEKFARENGILWMSPGNYLTNFDISLDKYFKAPNNDCEDKIIDLIETKKRKIDLAIEIVTEPFQKTKRKLDPELAQVTNINILPESDPKYELFKSLNQNTMFIE